MVDGDFNDFITLETEYAGQEAVQAIEGGQFPQDGTAQNAEGAAGIGDFITGDEVAVAVGDTGGKAADEILRVSENGTDADIRNLPGKVSGSFGTGELASLIEQTIYAAAADGKAQKASDLAAKSGAQKSNTREGLK